MSAGEIAILGGALALTGLMAWYFFGPRRSRQADVGDGVQIVRVTVKGGYSPDVIQVAPGVPVRVMFDRQESGDCSSRVVFPEFKVNKILPAFETTTVEFLPEALGEYEFACGMGMLHGKLRVVGEAAGSHGSSSAVGNILVGESASVGDTSGGRDVHITATADMAGGGDPLGAAAAAESADVEERERNTEIVETPTASATLAWRWRSTPGSTTRPPATSPGLPTAGLT